jgi:hypothetical protein
MVLKKYSSFINEGLIFKDSRCNECGEDNCLLIYYDSANMQVSIEKDEPGDNWIEQVKEDISKTEERYAVFFVCQACANDVNGYVMIDNICYKDPEAALLRILGGPKEIIKEEDIEWF